MIKYNVDTENGLSSIIGRDGNIFDKAIISDIFIKKTLQIPSNVHNELLNRKYKSLIEKDRKPLILDIGANIGCASVWFNSKYPKAKIVSLEPDHHNFQILKINSQERFEARNLALAPHNNGVSVRSSENPCAHITGDFGENWTPSTKLTDLIRRYSDCEPFILKIDIEGSEKQTFEVECDELCLFSLVIFEPHDWMLPGEKSSLSFMRQISRGNYEILLGTENLFFISI